MRAALEDREAEDYDAVETEADIEAKEERQELRRERKRDMRREMRMEARKAEKKSLGGRDRNEDRDVSEKIALGQAPKKSKDSMYDTRLFNHASETSTGGAYDIYSKPLLGRATAQSIYRPKANVDNEAYGGEVESLLEKSTGKFKPAADRAFSGTQQPTAARDEPVQFEADPFNIGEIFENKRSTALDGIGKSGGMTAAAGGSRADRDQYRERDRADERSGRRRNMEFSESSSSKRRKH